MSLHMCMPRHAAARGPAPRARSPAHQHTTAPNILPIPSHGMHGIHLVEACSLGASFRPELQSCLRIFKIILTIPERVWLWDPFSMAMDSCIHIIIHMSISMEVVLQVREVLSHVREHALAGSAQPLQPATVTAVAQLPMGDRVCVDLCSRLSLGEGLLVGNFCRTLFLVHSEVQIHPPRPSPLATKHNATMPAAYAMQSHTPVPVPSSLCRTTERVRGSVRLRAAVGPEIGGRRAAKASCGLPQQRVNHACCVDWAGEIAYTAQLGSAPPCFHAAVSVPYRPFIPDARGAPQQRPCCSMASLRSSARQHRAAHGASLHQA